MLCDQLVSVLCIPSGRRVICCLAGTAEVGSAAPSSQLRWADPAAHRGRVPTGKAGLPTEKAGCRPKKPGYDEKAGYPAFWPGTRLFHI